MRKKANKPGPADVNPTRRNDNGVMLCNAVPDCDKPASSQTVVVCGSCQDVQDATAAAIDRKTAEIGDEAGADEPQLTNDLEQLTVALAAVTEQHTHPVFACDKHAQPAEV